MPSIIRTTPFERDWHTGDPPIFKYVDPHVFKYFPYFSRASRFYRMITAHPIPTYKHTHPYYGH